MARAAIDIPARLPGRRAARARPGATSWRFVLTEMDANWDIAAADRRPMCADTGLPRYYAAGPATPWWRGFVALERALRRATAGPPRPSPIRPNRVHPLTRADHNNNVGMHAPEVTYAFEPDADWIDLTVVHKGGLFGSDYRMLFPADGIPGLKRFVVDTLVQFGKRGLACQPAIVGVGIGGSKDTCVRLGKEAACLRAVGSRNPDPEIAGLEEELTALGNYIGIGAMGRRHLHGGGHPIEGRLRAYGRHARGHPPVLPLLAAGHRAHPPDGGVAFRSDPRWFTDYYRRTGVE
jgi:L(+)-tartrate dehydratase alpha subunit